MKKSFERDINVSFMGDFFFFFCDKTQLFNNCKITVNNGKLFVLLSIVFRLKNHKKCSLGVNIVL